MATLTLVNLSKSKERREIANGLIANLIFLPSTRSQILKKTKKCKTFINDTWY